jgi:hypothetical protein
MFGLAALLMPGVDSSSSTSSATAGVPEASVTSAPAIAQAKCLTDLFMCPYLYPVNP